MLESKFEVELRHSCSIVVFHQDIFERLCASEVVNNLENLEEASGSQQATHPSAVLQNPAVLWLNYTDTRTGFRRVWPRYDNCDNHGNASNRCAREDFDPRYTLVSIT